MWYTAIALSPVRTWINHAHKTLLSDPWIKDGTVLNNGIYDNPRAETPCVITTETGYEMFYSGCDLYKWRIFHATSPDGVTWEKDGIIVEPTLPSEGSTAAMPAVIHEGDTYKMWYSGYTTNYRIFYAEKAPGHVAQDATCTVSFYLDSVDEANLIGTVENVFVPADGETSVSINWNPVAGEHEIIVVVSDVNPPDNDLSNNIASKPIIVTGPESAMLTVDKVRLTGPEKGLILTYYEWELLITVTNTGGSAVTDVLVMDVLPAELGLLVMNARIGYATTLEPSTRSSLPPPQILPVKSTRLTWVVGTLVPGQSETLYLKVCTRLNPAGKQEFSSPGVYVINEGAYATGIDMISEAQIISEPALAIEVLIEEMEPVVGLPPIPNPVNWNTVKIAKPVNQNW
jgi:uncharacterized repeat protein (TIGR01451 family)